MIALPSLAGVAPVYTAVGADSTAARCALAIAAPGAVAAPRRKLPLEQAVLHRELASWMERSAAGMRIFQPRLYVTLNTAPHCSCWDEGDTPAALWHGNANGEPWATRWRLDRRWAQLERMAPGLAPAALAAIDESCWRGAIPVYTPWQCLGMASWTYWMGENDEKVVIEEWADTNEDGKKPTAEELNILTRARLDAMLPCLNERGRALSQAKLERLRGAAGEVARAILELRQALRARPKKWPHEFHREYDDMHCVGYGATLRWSPRDCMPAVYDDHGNHLSEGYGVDESHFWLTVEGPEELPSALRQLERVHEISRAVEKLIPLIAERSE